MSAGRKWLFRLAALCLPLVPLLLLELCLRLAGYGYDTSFFKTERDASGKKYLINNDRFTLRFFPPELARWPGTFKIEANKPADTQRIFIFGESAAMGDPQPSVGASRYLEVLLRERFPNQKFEVINLGITAINSHVILPMAEEVAARGRGDVWLIYMGNNEMVGPFGAATVFGLRAPPLSAVRLNLAIQRTRVGQLVVSWLRKLGGKPAHSSWGGMKMFLQNQVAPNDVRRERIYQSFARNLGAIARAGQRAGAKIVLCTVSVNLRDCPPFGSLLNSNLPATEQKQFESVYSRGLELQTNGPPSEAAQAFSDAARLDPKFAELQFRWGQCLLSQTNTVAASERFQMACDVDALPFRADTRMNRTIRSLADELGGTNFLLCDAQAAVTSAAADGIAGNESFFEHVHFNFDGNYRLGKAWAEQVARLVPAGIQRTATSGWATQDFCERAIGLSDWNRMFVVSAVVGRMGQAPLALQFNNSIRLQALQRELEALRERQTRPNAEAQARAEFEAAMARAPDDAFLHENYGNFLESLGDTKAALGEYLKITYLLPHDFYGCLEAGRVLGDFGRVDQAEPLLRRAVAARPAMPEPWVELGTVLTLKTNYAEALVCFERSVQMRPSNPGYLANKAKILSKLGRHAEAIQLYRQAIKLDSGNWQTHFALACELADVDEVTESMQEYLEVMRLNPRHAATRINIGVLLFRQKRLDEAIRQFENALQIDPNNIAAQNYLRDVRQRQQQRRN